MSLVSVVVPIYKVEKYLDKCVRSIQRQTHQDLEIILVDDGSPDACGEMCDSYAQGDKRIKVIHKENGGLSDARNVGACAATGEYLLFVDSDDYISERLLEKTVAAAEKTKCDMVFFDFESIEEETGRRDIYHFGLPEEKELRIADYPELLLKTPSAWCRLYRKSFWDKTGVRYPIGIHYEDLATTPKLILQADTICYMGEEPLYHYMLRKGSIMRNHNFEKSYKDRTAVLSSLKEYFQEQKAEQVYRNEIEYLFFEHGYFVPSKEIILENAKSPWLERFRAYTLEQYPDVFKNPYIHQLSKKDKVLLFFMKRNQYRVMNLLSAVRKKKDYVIQRR